MNKNAHRELFENSQCKAMLACTMLTEYYKDICPLKGERLTLRGNTHKGEWYKITIEPLGE